jgi:hypothetical protein
MVRIGSVMREAPIRFELAWYVRLGQHIGTLIGRPIALLRPVPASLIAGTTLILALLPVACSNARAQGPWMTWRTLRMDAKSVPLFSGRLEMQLLEEEDESVLTTRTIARFLGARIASSSTRTVIDPASGRPKSYVMSSPKRGRRYSFGESSYLVEKLKPTQGPNAPLDEWDVTWSQEYDYPKGEDGKFVAVFDYYGMLLHLRHLPLDKPGDEVTLHVATSKGPVPYRILVGEIRSAERSYEDLETEDQRTLPVREFRLRIIPADPERAEEGFMKMEGETELWVEAESKTLLRLSGKVRKIHGRVHLGLSALG